VGHAVTARITAALTPEVSVSTSKNLRNRGLGPYASCFCIDFCIDFNPREIDMAQFQIAVIVGSLRQDSLNRKLASAVARLAPPEFTFKQLEIGDLPLYNQDDDNTPAASVKRLKSEISASQGLLFVTPEYNRSMPGVLKNAIDHASRPYGQRA